MGFVSFFDNFIQIRPCAKRLATPELLNPHGVPRQIKCATVAFTAYIQSDLVLSQKEGAALSALQPTMTLTIARRQLQEQFCAQFAGCLFPAA